MVPCAVFALQGEGGQVRPAKAHPHSAVVSNHDAGGVAALLTLLLQDSGSLPPELGPLRCITMGTGKWAVGRWW